MSIQTKTTAFPNLKVHNLFLGKKEHFFYTNPKIEVWVKVLHILIYLKQIKGKIFLSNTGIQTWLKDNYNYEISLSSAKQAIAKLRFDGFISEVDESQYHVKSKELRLTNGRIIKLKHKVIEYLRVTNLEDKLYAEGIKKTDQRAKSDVKVTYYSIKGRKASSRPRRLIRKKMYTIVDYVNIKKNNLKEQFRAYVTYQADKYFKPAEGIDQVTGDEMMMNQEKQIHLLQSIMNEIDVGYAKN